MQTRFKDGSIMIAGFLARDAEYRQVGSKNTDMTRFSVKAGERPVPGQEKPEPIWVSCTCWHELARKCRGLQKFDTVLCVGRIQTNEGNDGKTYTELICEYVNWTPRLDGVKEITAKAESAGVPTYELDEDDGDLPF